MIAVSRTKLAELGRLARDAMQHYHRHTQRKRDGSRRPIAAPDQELKTAQRWIARLVLALCPVHPAAHGFAAHRSTVTNAREHAGAGIVAKLDIRGFFPSVPRARVVALLRGAGLAEDAADVIARVATDPRTGALPQGAPSSPAITNALCLSLDQRCEALATAHGAHYTRFADDLTFSWPSAPPDVVETLLRAAVAAIEAEGFAVHPDKTKITRAGARQTITGLVVNAAPGAAPARLPRASLRALRAAIHNREHGKTGPETLDQLRGLAALVHATDAAKGRAFLDRINALERKHRP